MSARSFSAHLRDSGVQSLSRPFNLRDPPVSLSIYEISPPARPLSAHLRDLEGLQPRRPAAPEPPCLGPLSHSARSSLRLSWRMTGPSSPTRLKITKTVRAPNPPFSTALFYSSGPRLALDCMMGSRSSHPPPRPRPSVPRSPPSPSLHPSLPPPPLPPSRSLSLSLSLCEAAPAPNTDQPVLPFAQRAPSGPPPGPAHPGLPRPSRPAQHRHSDALAVDPEQALAFGPGGPGAKTRPSRPAQQKLEKRRDPEGGRPGGPGPLPHRLLADVSDALSPPLSHPPSLPPSLPPSHPPSLPPSLPPLLSVSVPLPAPVSPALGSGMRAGAVAGTGGCGGGVRWAGGGGQVPNRGG